MANPTLWIIIFSIFGGVFSMIGGVALTFNDKWVKQNTSVLVGWAAGVLLSVSFLDLYPEAIELAIDQQIGIPRMFMWSLSAMISFFLLERSLVWFHHHHDAHHQKPTNLMLVFGDSLHNFVDGVIIAAAFFVNLPLGVVTALAVAAHEIPQEIADFGIMLQSGMSKRKTIMLNLLSSLMTLIGAVVALLFIVQVKQILPQILAFTAGLFTYIAASDLIPELHRDKVEPAGAWVQVASFAAGVLITYGLQWFTHFVT